ncbi:hypothetical protein SEA_DAUBENSKI_25 [Streptomyces phage Daubenski]|uniref:Uncharacterized protein n=1 Tax=Streptomyces phage Daubenski TaxID=2653725 RepID=A0A5Q2WIJ5_9CAUD|nr:hypothetical protein KNU80_gp025 [Streptomyces phage Daubenski]QGH76335.1 hypothetical protein SEA_DAUBENSKI_25 [Streptomyces phage Daubenski]
MKVHELIERMKNCPDYEVQIGTKDVIGPVRDVYIDCFDAEEGMCIVIEVDDSE